MDFNLPPIQGIKQFLATELMGYPTFHQSLWDPFKNWDHTNLCVKRILDSEYAAKFFCQVLSYWEEDEAPWELNPDAPGYSSEMEWCIIRRCFSMTAEEVCLAIYKAMTDDC